ncbi:MAG: sensor histidine kinase [Pseudobdellovibrionaceae bacterium]
MNIKNFLRKNRVVLISFFLLGALGLFLAPFLSKVGTSWLPAGISLGSGFVFSGILSGFFFTWVGRKQMHRGVSRQLRTELKEKEKRHESIRRLEMDLAHIWRVNTIGEMASGLAHELSQPISAIGNYVQALHRLAEKSDLQEPLFFESIAEISKETSRAANFIQNLRSFIKNRRPQQTNEKINEIIYEIIALITGELKSNGLSLELKLEASHAVVFADRVQIGQVILNLLRNAIESMAKGQSFKLIIETAYEMPGFARVSVTDEGCGISEEHRDQIFEALFTTKANGMGLGLAISKSIVEAHSGRLWMESQLGIGTTFHMTLPLA